MRPRLAVSGDMDELAAAAAGACMSVDEVLEADQQLGSTVEVQDAAAVLRAIDGNAGEP